MKNQYVLTPLGKAHMENCLITAMNHGEFWMLEIWDVTTDYHSLKPCQNELENNSTWHKYKNKRYEISEEELFNKYRVLCEL